MWVGTKSFEKDEDRISRRPVKDGNGREIARLQFHENQQEIAAELNCCLAVCCYGNDCHPMGIY